MVGFHFVHMKSTVCCVCDFYNAKALCHGAGARKIALENFFWRVFNEEDDVKIREPDFLCRRGITFYTTCGDARPMSYTALEPLKNWLREV